MGPVKLIEVDVLVEVEFGVFGRVMAVVPVDVSKHVKYGGGRDGSGIVVVVIIIV